MSTTKKSWMSGRRGRHGVAQWAARLQISGESFGKELMTLAPMVSALSSARGMPLLQMTRLAAAHPSLEGQRPCRSLCRPGGRSRRGTCSINRVASAVFSGIKVVQLALHVVPPVSKGRRSQAQGLSIVQLPFRGQGSQESKGCSTSILYVKSSSQDRAFCFPAKGW